MQKRSLFTNRNHLDFSPDMSYLVSGDGDGKCYIWDWKTTKLYKKWQAHDNVCIATLWHPHEASKLVTAGWDGVIKYWDWTRSLDGVWRVKRMMKLWYVGVILLTSRRFRNNDLMDVIFELFHVKLYAVKDRWCFTFIISTKQLIWLNKNSFGNY